MGSGKWRFPLHLAWLQCSSSGFHRGFKCFTKPIDAAIEDVAAERNRFASAGAWVLVVNLFPQIAGVITLTRHRRRVMAPGASKPLPHFPRRW